MTHSNPLLQKWEEIYGKKEEPKKVEPPEFWKESPFAYDPTTSVNTPTTINPNSVSSITAANPFPITKLTSYDNESLNDSFLQIAEKVKNRQAQIYSMNMDIDQQTRTQRITFEVWDTF